MSHPTHPAAVYHFQGWCRFITLTYCFFFTNNLFYRIFALFFFINVEGYKGQRSQPMPEHCQNYCVTQPTFNSSKTTLTSGWYFILLLWPPLELHSRPFIYLKINFSTKYYLVEIIFVSVELCELEQFVSSPREMRNMTGSGDCNKTARAANGSAINQQQIEVSLKGKLAVSTVCLEIMGHWILNCVNSLY